MFNEELERLQKEVAVVQDQMSQVLKDKDRMAGLVRDHKAAKEAAEAKTKKTLDELENVQRRVSELQGAATRANEYEQKVGELSNDLKLAKEEANRQGGVAELAKREAKRLKSDLSSMQAALVTAESELGPTRKIISALHAHKAAEDTIYAEFEHLDIKEHV